MSAITMKTDCPFCRANNAVLGSCYNGYFVNCPNPNCQVNLQGDGRPGVDRLLEDENDQVMVESLLFEGPVVESKDSIVNENKVLDGPRRRR